MAALSQVMPTLLVAKAFGSSLSAVTPPHPNANTATHANTNSFKLFMVSPLS
ncbi:hypothetical protein [Myxococcus sp. AS-1-15]|uniref:hypothetical protein n=1 Tax=Myxococcus sp. AS-1-15 TaxID=2874600 RepID=UPI001CBD93E8|nr:hypothetical protein [Myxococcus sp. AS-1-15]MBZ4402497.1 hypothetical protein [Myxococcus sp. AS-1-15]